MTTASIDLRPATRLRLTRRGRAVLLTVVMTPVLAAIISTGLNAGAAAAGDASMGSGSLATVTVAEGESLWNIAESIAPSRDPRDVVADIVRLNGLDSANVAAGAQIALPAY